MLATLGPSRIVTRFPAEIVHEAECDPHGRVVIAWLDDWPLYMDSQGLLKAGIAGVRSLMAELVAGLDTG